MSKPSKRIGKLSALVADGGIVLPVNYLFSIIYHLCCSALSSVTHARATFPVLQEGFLSDVIRHIMVYQPVG